MKYVIKVRPCTDADATKALSSQFLVSVGEVWGADSKRFSILALRDVELEPFKLPSISATTSDGITLVVITLIITKNGS